MSLNLCNLQAILILPVEFRETDVKLRRKLYKDLSSLEAR